MTFVYILTNEAMPGLIKIGRTSTSVEQRLSELNRNTAIPLPFVCYYAAQVENSEVVEKRLHEAFGDHRIRAKREFFRLSPHRAQAALELAAISEATPREEIIDDYPEDAERAINRENARRLFSGFSDCGIPIGSTLEFTKNKDLTAVVNGEKTVLFNGETSSLSAAALIALNSQGYNWKSAHGSAYWEYEGESIWDRLERLNSYE